ncbi:DUF2975 domain-containing protein [Lactobacillus ultunensis]|nr:DUF2975 domain-containing protein [Lactobacillus ultunensis]QQP28367.1 DUF2975 domain-containing protein [Lactobacillus ultunensis]
MRKFILNLLTVLAWIYQIVCVLGLIIFVPVFVMMFFIKSNPDFREGFMSTFNTHGASSIDQIILVMEITFFLLIVVTITTFLICCYARLIIKNIKREIYFAADNLQLLRKLLITVGVYTVCSVIEYVLLLTHRTCFSTYTTNDMIYPGSITNGLLFLAVFYVVYLVFKYGMKIQEDADSII